MQPPWEQGLPWRQLHAGCGLLALALRRDSPRGFSGDHPSQGAASQAAVSPLQGPPALGPSRECAFSQQCFGLKSGSQAALTSHLPGRGIQSPHGGECGGSSSVKLVAAGEGVPECGTPGVVTQRGSPACPRPGCRPFAARLCSEAEIWQAEQLLASAVGRRCSGFLEKCQTGS